MKILPEIGQIMKIISVKCMEIGQIMKIISVKCMVSVSEAYMQRKVNEYITERLHQT